MSFKSHRERLAALLPDDSLVISHAGVPIHTNEDDYYNFEVNSQFFYLTGLEREGMVLVMKKASGVTTEALFIEQADPLAERWTGKMPTKEDAERVSEIRDIRWLTDLADMLDRTIGTSEIRHAWFDTFRNSVSDLPDYNLLQANEFHAKYPGMKIENLRTLTMKLRQVKDEDEIDRVRKAIAITKQGLENVMQHLHSGMTEYQVQADFEYRVHQLGAVKFAFNTIAGSGLNGCMMHYGTNRCTVEPGSMILLDLGAKYENYCSDITRTYPADGKYSPRQREYYELVLSANRAVAEAARPGVTLRELNDLTKKILGEGLVRMGKISDVSEVGKYYMHGVSHSIGIDCHDSELRTEKLEPGWIISDEPGLYIDEEKIGIRIEDDLLITENGCEVLSRDVIRDPDEIEAYMAAHRA